MVLAPSGRSDPEPIHKHRETAAQIASALDRGDIPWLHPAWLESVGAVDAHFVSPAACDVNEAFQELFASTGIDWCLGADTTFYSQFDDMVHLADWRGYAPAAFHRDWIHELIHATGHATRLDRDLPLAFGPNAHGAEDLIAEVGASIVCTGLGIEPGLRHPESLALWIDLLRSDQHAFGNAMRQARDAASYLFALRNAQAAAFDRLEAEEAGAGRAAVARATAARRLGRQAERERKRCASRR